MMSKDYDVKEFYNYMMNLFSDGKQWTISLDGKTITLPNCAEVFQGISQAIEDYAAEECIELKSTNEYLIESSDFDYTGGGVWILSSEIYLPNEGKTIYAVTDEYYCFIYTNKEDFDEMKNPDCTIHHDGIGFAPAKYQGIARALFDKFNEMRKNERGF